MKQSMFRSFLIAMSLGIGSVCAHDIVVSCDPDNRCSAMVNGTQYRCSVGKNGLTADKVEGDGCTPVGSFPLRQIFFRSDKIDAESLKTTLPVQAITPSDGWCDAPKDAHYNQHVDFSRGDFERTISHEGLHRQDDLYDIVLVVGYNDSPPISGKGSAIFVHVAREGYTGTAGCVAFSKQDLMNIIAQLDVKSLLKVKPY